MQRLTRFDTDLFCVYSQWSLNSGRAVLEIRHPRRGLTLVEVSVATALLLIGLLATLSVMASSLGLSENSHRHQRAASALRSKLAELRAAPWQDLLVQYQGQTSQLDSLGVHGGVLLVSIGSESSAAVAFGRSVDLDLDGTSNEVEAAHNQMLSFYVELRADWIAGGHSQTRNLQTLLHERPE